MSIVEKHMEFVNKQITFQEQQATRFSSNAYRRELHTQTANNLRELLNDFVRVEKALDEAVARAAQKDSAAGRIPSLTEMALKPEDIEGLPAEVIAELSVSGADPQDFNIISVLNEAGGILSLDRIVIRLYRVYGEKVKRATLISRLNRMIPKGLLYSVPNRKGLYSTTQIANEGQSTHPDGSS
jgi:hypothetical protein